MLQQTRLDITDLRIIKLLSRDSRTPYRNIASAIGIMPSAAKERINKMFVLFVNPVILGYEKECILILRHVDKTIKEQDILNRVSLLGDVLVYILSLEGTANFILSVKDRAQDKIGILTDLLKPSKVESIFARYTSVAMKIHSSDLKIMKCLLSDPRMLIEDIAEATSLSPKTVARRLDKMRENHVLQFSIVTNPSSLNLTGYIEFGVLIRAHAAYHQNVVQRIYNEMQEYIQHPLDELPHYPINYSISYQNAFVFASFLCANISTVNLILRRLETYDGVNKVEPITITSGRVYQDWLTNEIDKRIISQKYSSLPSSAASPPSAANNDI